MTTTTAITMIMRLESRSSVAGVGWPSVSIKEL
jgi:hypothetical protein